MNKQELKAKAKEFVKKHKKAIVLTSLTVGGVVVYVLTKKRIKVKDIAKVSEPVKIDWEKQVKDDILRIAPDWKTGELTEINDMFDDGIVLEAIVNRLKPADLGKVGEDLLKCANVTDESQVSAIMYVMSPQVE